MISIEKFMVHQYGAFIDVPAFWAENSDINCVSRRREERSSYLIRIQARLPHNEFKAACQNPPQPTVGIDEHKLDARRAAIDRQDHEFAGCMDKSFVIPHF